MLMKIFVQLVARYGLMVMRNHGLVVPIVTDGITEGVLVCQRKTGQ